MGPEYALEMEKIESLLGDPIVRKKATMITDLIDSVAETAEEVAAIIIIMSSGLNNYIKETGGN